MILQNNNMHIKEILNEMAKDKNIFSFRKVTHISKRRPVRVIAFSGIAAAILTFFAIPIFQSDTPKTDPLIVAAEIPTTPEQKESTPVLESAPTAETTSKNESFSAPLEESTTNESDVLAEIENDNGENSEAEKEGTGLGLAIVKHILIRQNLLFWAGSYL